MCAQAREKTVALAAAATGCKLEEEAAVAAAVAEERPPEIIQTSLQWRGTNPVEYIATDAASTRMGAQSPVERVHLTTHREQISFSQSLEKEE